MARAKALAKQRVRDLKRKGITPASQGLTEEGKPLPKPDVIDVSASDADDDADRGEEAKAAWKESADGDPDPGDDGSVRVLANLLKKKNPKAQRRPRPMTPIPHRRKRLTRTIFLGLVPRLTFPIVPQGEGMSFRPRNVVLVVLFLR